MAKKALVIWPHIVRPLVPLPVPVLQPLAFWGLLNTPGEGLGAFISGVYLDNSLPSFKYILKFYFLSRLSWPPCVYHTAHPASPIPLTPSTSSALP